MKFIFSLIAVFVMATYLTGCIVVGGHDSDGDHHASWQSQQKENRQFISQLELKTSRSLVLDRLGSPDYSEALTIDQDEYRVLYYRTHHRHSDGKTSKDETTPLIFKNNLLIGWGEDMLAKLRH